MDTEYWLTNHLGLPRKSVVRLTDRLVGHLSVTGERMDTDYWCHLGQDHLGLPRKSVVKLTDCLIGQLSVTGERMDTKYWLTT